MIYGYVRVSTTTQNIARQMEEMYKLSLPGLWGVRGGEPRGTWESGHKPECSG